MRVGDWSSGVCSSDLTRDKQITSVSGDFLTNAVSTACIEGVSFNTGCSGSDLLAETPMSLSSASLRQRTQRNQLCAVMRQTLWPDSRVAAAGTSSHNHEIANTVWRERKSGG